MFSVIIPLYNKAHTIIRTVTSVINQKFRDFEIIIVDDGSTDNGVQEVRNTIKDERLKVILQENRGVSAARNLGVANAKYKYIAFLDADDTWMPEYLLKMAEAINIFPDSGMYCCAGVYKEDDKIISYRIAEKYKNIIREIDYFENPHIFSHTSATVVSKNLFNELRGFKNQLRVNEDLELFFSLAIVSKVIYIGIPLSCYYGGIEGQTSTNHSTNINGYKNKAERMNLTYNFWIEHGKKNNTFLVFLKYELRNAFKILLVEKRYDLLKLYINCLNNNVKKNFYSLELQLYRNGHLRILSLAYIVITKLLWRLNRYPRVGGDKYLQ